MAPNLRGVWIPPSLHEEEDEDNDDKTEEEEDTKEQQPRYTEPRRARASYLFWGINWSIKFVETFVKLIKTRSREKEVGETGTG